MISVFLYCMRKLYDTITVLFQLVMEYCLGSTADILEGNSCYYYPHCYNQVGVGTGDVSYPICQPVCRLLGRSVGWSVGLSEWRFGVHLYQRNVFDSCMKSLYFHSDNISMETVFICLS